MNKLLKSLLMGMIASFLVVGSAMALPWDGLGSGWTVSGSMDYWTVTDLTTGEDGDSFFQIQLEQAAYESAFGLYTVDDIGKVSAKFEIFAASNSSENEPYAMQNVSFLNENGNWSVTTSYSADGNSTNDGWVAFSNMFGFYYDVDQGADGDIDYTFFTDNSLNTAEAGEEHIMTAYNNKWAYIYLDDQIGNGDGDFTDMTVFADDVAPAPVPEPATILLFGMGLLGIAGINRRKK